MLVIPDEVKMPESRMQLGGGSHAEFVGNERTLEGYNFPLSHYILRYYEDELRRTVSLQMMSTWSYRDEIFGSPRAELSEPRRDRLWYTYT